MQCHVYKCRRKPDTYLYMPAADDPDDLPQELLKLTGGLERVLELELNRDTRLAQANAGDVLAAIRAQGFYLQMPGELPGMFR